MLSPGEWYRDVPRQLEANLKYRLRLNERSLRGPREQQALLRACESDILFWVNSYVWQHNPNTIGVGSMEVGPFITWDFQDEAVFKVLDYLEKREDLVFEKSREMGASWLCLLIMDWFFLFHSWKKFLMISRNADAVDKPGDSDSLFWKLDFVHRHLPSWMTVGRINKRKFGYENPATNSSITGQASTGKAGVGGRAFGMFIDEFSLIAEDFEVHHHTASTTGCRIFNGTHRGTDTCFYQLTHGPLAADYGKLQMHWTQHPDKRKGLYRYDAASNKVEVLDTEYEFPPDFQFVMTEAPTGGPYPGIRSPWYDKMCLRLGTSRAVAMDLDIDPGGSQAQFFNAIVLRQLRSAYSCEPYWEGDISYDRDSGRPLALVKVPGGPVKMWVQPKVDGSVPPSKYGAGADLSTGSGATESVLSIMDAVTGEKVLEYASAHILPENFAPIVTALCWLFKDDYGEGAKLAWETPGPGIVFGKRVMELSYGNIHYREGNLSGSSGKHSDIPGWHSNNVTKRALLDDYRAALECRDCVNRSDKALEEFGFFRWKPNGDVEHSKESGGDDPATARVNHGDRVIADALAWKMVKSLGYGGAKKKVEPEAVPVLSLAWRRQLRHNQLRQEEAWA